MNIYMEQINRSDMTKEQLSKEYAKEQYPYTEEMRFQCEQHYEAGWDKALECQWIKVEDNLPNVGISVLVLTSNKKVSMTKRYQPKDCYGNNVGIVRWSGSSAFENSIVAWMPIPSFDKILEGNKDVLKRLKDK